MKRPDPLPWPDSMKDQTIGVAIALERAQEIAFNGGRAYHFVTSDNPRFRTIWYGFDRNLRLMKRFINRRGPSFRNAFITEYYIALVTR